MGPGGADSDDVTSIPVDCLRCGKRHHLLRTHHSTIDEGECPRCGYLGWAPAPSSNVARRAASQIRPRISGDPRPSPFAPQARSA
jgi:hypothetical protein